MKIKYFFYLKTNTYYHSHIVYKPNLNKISRKYSKILHICYNKTSHIKYFWQSSSLCRLSVHLYEYCVFFKKLI